MKAAYQIADRKDSRALAQFLSGEGQSLLPMLELIEQAEMAVDELIDVAGRATIEAVLTLSAQALAGPKHPGKKAGGAIGWHGPAGVVGHDVGIAASVCGRQFVRGLVRDVHGESLGLAGFATALFVHDERD